MSWKPEVQTDNSGKWYGNALRFAAEHEAKAYVNDLEMRWTAVIDTRVICVDEPVTYAWTASGAQPINTVTNPGITAKQGA